MSLGIHTAANNVSDVAEVIYICPPPQQQQPTLMHTPPLPALPGYFWIREVNHVSGKFLDRIWSETESHLILSQLSAVEEEKGFLEWLSLNWEVIFKKLWIL